MLRAFGIYDRTNIFQLNRSLLVAQAYESEP